MCVSVAMKNPILWTLISCVALREFVVFVDFCLFFALAPFYPLPFNSFICLSFSLFPRNERESICIHISHARPYERVTIFALVFCFAVMWDEGSEKGEQVCSISSRLSIAFTSIQSSLFLIATKFRKYSM